MAEIVEKIQAIVQEALKHPLALPIFVGFITVYFSILVLYSIAKSSVKKPKKAKAAKGTPISAGTTVVDGIRRSTRAPKSSTKLDPEDFIASPAPRKTPSKAVPETPIEATTVSPKRRGRPTKTLIAEEEPTTTPRLRGRPRRA